MANNKLLNQRKEIINSIQKKEASMLEASSIEYIEKIYSEHFYNEDNKEIYWIKNYYTRETNMSNWSLYFEYNVTDNKWDFFIIPMFSYISPFIKFYEDHTPIYSKDIKDDDLLKKFDSIIPNYKDLIIEDKANVKKFKEMFPAGSIIRYENELGVVKTEAKWVGFNNIRIGYGKIYITDDARYIGREDEINCFDHRLKQSSISEVKDACKKFVENKNCKSIEKVSKLNKKIEECKSKIESIHESIVDYQNEICELNNSISNLDYNISTTTNEILQLLK